MTSAARTSSTSGLPASLRLEHRGHVLVVTLARAHKRNALDDDTVRALGRLFDDLPAGVRAVVIAADGDHFCAGLDLSSLLSYSQAEGGFRTSMSWVVDLAGGSQLTGATPVYQDFNWFHGGSFSDTTLPSPQLLINASSFDLDVTLFYVAAGASVPGCSSATGLCSALSANSVKVWANTVASTTPPPAVPEPGTLSLLAVGCAVAAGGSLVAASFFLMAPVTADWSFWELFVPQAMRVIVPPFGNETISMLKTTSLVAYVPFYELLFAVQNNI